MPTPFPVFFPGEAPLKTVDQIATLTQRATIPPKLYPQMVTVDFPKNPATVRAVDPANLAATFGPGISLLTLEMQINDAPLTSGDVAKVLSWLPAYQAFGWRLNGENCIACPIASGSLADLLDPGHFVAMPRKSSHPLDKRIRHR